MNRHAVDPIRGAAGTSERTVAFDDQVNDPARFAVSQAVWISGLRCLLTYLLFPALAPALGLTVATAIPLIVALHVLGIWMSARAVRRARQSKRHALALVASTLLAVNLLALASHL